MGIVFVSSLIACHICFGVLKSVSYEKFVYAYRYANSEISKDDYLLAVLPEYDFIKRINSQAAENECVYLLYTSNAFYYYKPCLRSGGYQSGRELIQEIKSAQSYEDLYNFFVSHDIKFLFANVPRTQKIFQSNLTKDELALWSLFAKDFLKLEFAQNNYGFWKLILPEQK